MEEQSGEQPLRPRESLTVSMCIKSEAMVRSYVARRAGFPILFQCCGEVFARYAFFGSG